MPDSRVGGVGFDDYGDYIKRREDALNTSARAPSQAIVPPSQFASGPAPTIPARSGAPTAAELAQAGVSGAAALAGQQTAQAAVQPLPAATAAPNNVGISDEQDFSAVSSRESIASDKQRIAENRAQYQQIQPGELPQRDGKITGPDLIEYAIKAPNRLGESIYPRSGISLSNSQANCARYANPEEAQLAFLNSGGPKRDSKNLDPDGDGFACFWDPTPFQKVRG
ncbi:MAG: hypothetical protein R3E44_06220 [Paracoccaceae bacterium]